MISITITEKLWDEVRPSSVKKTGLSEAIKVFNKSAPKAPDSPKTFDEACEAIKKLGTAIDGAAEAVKKVAKDDKKNAAAKLKTWKQECDHAVTTLTNERKQLGILKAGKEADGQMKAIAETLEQAIKDADELVKNIQAGRQTDVKSTTLALQNFRDAARNALKVTQKDGFVQFIATYDAVLAWHVNPADVPLPPACQTMKTRIPVLVQAAEKARVAVEEIMKESSKSRTGDAAELAKPLVAEYQGLIKELKSFVPIAQKLGNDVKVIGDKFKELIGQGQTYDKLIPPLQVMHTKILAFDEKTMKELARGRVASGDIQAERIRVRDSLKDRQELWVAFEKIMGEEWNFCMTVYREVSEQIGIAYRQVERVLRLVGEMSEPAKAECEKLRKQYADEEQALKGRYMK